MLDVISLYSGMLTIKHVKSTRKGLSYNRNLGIKHASGSYISIPDDDCEYYDDTIKAVEDQLARFSNPDMIIGRVFNRNDKKYVFKKTPRDSLEINNANFYSVVSSITFFFKKTTIQFDENFGIGEKYHSNEDADLILNFLKAKKRVIYSPLIEFNHPAYDANTMSVEKLYRYGIGFGALCKKHLSLPIFILFIKVLSFQIFMLLKEMIFFNFSFAKRRFFALKGRFIGFFIYRRP